MADKLEEQLKKLEGFQKNLNELIPQLRAAEKRIEKNKVKKIFKFEGKEYQAVIYETGVVQIEFTDKKIAEQFFLNPQKS